MTSTDEAFREILDILILGALRTPCHYIKILLSSELLPYFQKQSSYLNSVSPCELGHMEQKPPDLQSTDPKSYPQYVH